MFIDNNPLIYELTTAKLDAASHRWLADLSVCNFDICDKAGQHNVDADGLSRRPHGPSPDDDESQEMDQRISSMLNHISLSPNEFKDLNEETFHTLCMRHSVRVQADCQDAKESDAGLPAVETLLCNESGVPDEL